MLAQSTTDRSTAVGTTPRRTARDLFDLFHAEARGSSGITATRAAQIMYGVERPNAEQWSAALDHLKRMTQSGRLVRFTERRVSVEQLLSGSDDYTPRSYPRGTDRVADVAVARADRAARDGASRRPAAVRTLAARPAAVGDQLARAFGELAGAGVR